MPTPTGVKCPGRAACLLATLGALLGAPTLAAAEDCGAPPAFSAVGLAALDGDTFRTTDGREWRLAGVLAPKRGDGARMPAGIDDDAGRRAARPPGSPADAARVALEALVARQTLWLVPVGETEDRYGRRLVTAAATTCRSIAERLLVAGHARVYPTVATRGMAAALYKAEAAARAGSRGLWGDARYRVLRAAETAGRFDSYVVVEDRVVSVTATRSGTTLLFGPDRQRDFGLAIEPRVRKFLAPAGIEIAGLVGRPVRVRGWLRQRGGAPVIDLVVPEQLEVIEP